MSPTLLEPRDVQAAAAMLAQATTDGVAVVPRGSGTKLSWGGVTTRVDAFMSTRLLNSPIQHFAGDLVATLPAGATLAEVNAVLSRERQWLPLDPSGGSFATIGGIVATNDSGPRRQKHGSARDLIIGIEVALADGRLAKAGGRVVKNVAGYDLARLMCGSFGSLALITSATFKLAPLAPASRTVVAEVKHPQQASEIALAVNAAPLSPSAIEVQAPRHRLLVRFETTEQAASRQASATQRIFERAGLNAEVAVGHAEADIWIQHEALIWAHAGAILKVAVLPTEVAGVLLEIDRLAAATTMTYGAIGRAALGVLMVRLNGDTSQTVQAIDAVRRVAAGRAGSAVVLEAAAEVWAQVDPWDHVGSAAGVMHAVKSRFDPRHTLGRAPGCGGL
jgi:glycolate dehydrogenase FAD-binding subunit